MRGLADRVPAKGKNLQHMFDVEANSAFVPCGHACSCIDCAKGVVGRNCRTTRDDIEVRLCPLCRGVV